MSDTSNIWQGRFAGAVEPSTGQNHEILERGTNLLQNGILNFAIGLSQLLIIASQSWNLHRGLFEKGSDT